MRVNENSLHPVLSDGPTPETLNDDLRRARAELRAAEAELAAEQAAVNAFRMHARLMLDDLADALLSLRARKQALLTALALQADDNDDPLGPDAPADAPPSADDDLPLPTDTPRDRAAEKRLFRELARRFHPDLANSAAELAYRTSVMTAVNSAYAAGDVETLYDLAGELEPEELRQLAATDTRVLRQLREQLMRCRQRQRKVARQLAELRRENTARLWQRARELEEPNDNWWAAVRRELEAARARLSEEIAALEAQLAQERGP